MGVVYKLKPDVVDFVLRIKKDEPQISCRALVSRIEEKFKVRISKSSINTIFKNAGLSMPVGRRPKKRRGELEVVGLGVVLLKAADYLIGGTRQIAEITKTPFSPESDLLKIEVTSIQTSSIPEISGALKISLQEVRAIKVSFSDGLSFYLDGQFHTVWSALHIPYDFSNTIYNTKERIKYLSGEDSTLVFFMAPGYDSPTKEFFNFILSSQEKNISKTTLYNPKFEEIETIHLEKPKKQNFIFGLWSWQFGRFRRVKSISEFKPFYFEPLKKNFFIAEAEIELSQPIIDKTVILKGCALKASPSEEIKLFILGNLPFENPISLVELYLNHWPNLEEGFRDFSKKIEASVYTGGTQSFFSTQAPALLESIKDTNSLLDQYLKVLDLYVRWHFLPLGYKERDFATTKAQIYDLSGQRKIKRDFCLVTFKPPSEYPHLKDLEYACHRINERGILIDNKHLWCGV